MQKPVRAEVMYEGEPKPGVESFLRLIAAGSFGSALAVFGLIMLLVLAYVAVERSFGLEGTRYLLMIVGIAALAYAINGIHASASRRATDMLKSVTYAQMMQERADDQGEIARMVAQNALTMARQQENNTERRALWLAKEASKLSKSPTLELPDLGVNVDFDESAFMAGDPQ